VTRESDGVPTRMRRLDTLATGAEVVASVAVVASLLFVGVQVRQSAAETALNTRTAGVNAYQDLQDLNTTLNVLAIENPELRNVKRRVREGDALDAPSDRDARSMWFAYVRIVMRTGDLAFYQYESGLIDEERLRSMLGALRAEVLATPLGLTRWKTTTESGAYAAAYVNYVDSLFLGGGSVPSP
jgi:hypothetical protein